MLIRLTDKYIFRGIVFYLPFSIFLIFWLYFISLVYEDNTWQYQLFYGKGGSIALVWLLMVLLPALIFLLSNTSGKVFLSRFSGAAGFYLLLASLISSFNFLAVPGFVLIFIGKLMNRSHRKISNQPNFTEE